MRYSRNAMQTPAGGVSSPPTPSAPRRRARSDGWGKCFRPSVRRLRCLPLVQQLRPRQQLRRRLLHRPRRRRREARRFQSRHFVLRAHHRLRHHRRLPNIPRWIHRRLDRVPTPICCGQALRSGEARGRPRRRRPRACCESAPPFRSQPRRLRRHRSSRACVGSASGPSPSPISKLDLIAAVTLNSYHLFPSFSALLRSLLDSHVPYNHPGALW